MREEYSYVEESNSPVIGPGMLRAYDAAIPDGANRVFTLIEDQAHHRMAMERKVLSNNIWMERLGLLSGFLLGLVGIGGGIYLIGTGQDVSGLAALVAALVALVRVYTTRSNETKKELEAKRQAVQAPGPGQHD